MTHGQYQIPQSSYGSIEADIFRSTQEQAAQSIEVEVDRFAFVKSIEDHIDSLRATATEANLPKPGIVRSLGQLISIRSPRPLEERLVNAESELGGNLLADHPTITNKRFWYYGGYWYLELKDQNGPMVASYQFTTDTAYKLAGGKEVPFDHETNELERVLALIPTYRDHVHMHLYAKRSDYDLAA